MRGLANEIITPTLALELAQAAALVLGHEQVAEGTRPRAVIANDSRASADFIVSAMKAGFTSAGVDVLDAGIVPTPAAAYLVAYTDADFGVMISASHNPAPITALNSWRVVDKSLKTPPKMPLSACTGKRTLGTLPGVRSALSAP